MQFEGSFTLWECSIELLRHLDNSTMDFKNLYILDIGCGLGCIGIYCLIKGAKVLFHDYN